MCYLNNKLTFITKNTNIILASKLRFPIFYENNQKRPDIKRSIHIFKNCFSLGF